jgi:hypothetical protein
MNRLPSTRILTQSVVNMTLMVLSAAPLAAAEAQGVQRVVFDLYCERVYHGSARQWPPKFSNDCDRDYWTIELERIERAPLRVGEVAKITFVGYNAVSYSPGVASTIVEDPPLSPFAELVRILSRSLAALSQKGPRPGVAVRIIDLAARLNTALSEIDKYRGEVRGVPKKVANNSLEQLTAARPDVFRNIEDLAKTLDPSNEAAPRCEGDRGGKDDVGCLPGLLAEWQLACSAPGQAECAGVLPAEVRALASADSPLMRAHDAYSGLKKARDGYDAAADPTKRAAFAVEQAPAALNPVSAKARSVTISVPMIAVGSTDKQPSRTYEATLRVVGGAKVAPSVGVAYLPRSFGFETLVEEVSGTGKTTRPGFVDTALGQRFLPLALTHFRVKETDLHLTVGTTIDKSVFKTGVLGLTLAVREHNLWLTFGAITSKGATRSQLEGVLAQYPDLTGANISKVPLPKERHWRVFVAMSIAP